MRLVITIDTEEDNWGEYRADRYTTENLHRIPAVQSLFEQFGFKPTYLISYPVATDPWSIEMFSRYLARGTCEIGMHCHPWNTPPHEEEINAYTSMLCNLPEGLQYRKLKTLKKVILDNLGVDAVSFRSGRWAFGNSTARALHRLGCTIDSSVTPYTDWSSWHGVDYRHQGPDPYRFSPADIFREDSRGVMLQVPASIGFLQKNFDRSNRILRFLEKSELRRYRLKGILERLRCLNKVSLSPEGSTSREMIALARCMQKTGFTVLNMFFHSASLKGGLGPFVRNAAEEREFMQRIEEFLMYCRKVGMESFTLCSLANRCAQPDGVRMLRHQQPASMAGSPEGR